MWSRHMFSIDNDNKIDNAPCSAVTFFERADLVHFQSAQVQETFWQSQEIPDKQISDQLHS